jgi:hypothetical protein
MPLTARETNSLRLTWRQDRELDAVIGEHLKAREIDGCFRKPHACGFAAKAEFEMAIPHRT